MYMHPLMAHEISRQREGELRSPARRYSQLGPRRRRRCGAAGHRAGWVLIEIGLSNYAVSVMEKALPSGSRKANIAGTPGQRRISSTSTPAARSAA
jgi:hypothetical protein